MKGLTLLSDRRNHTPEKKNPAGKPPGERREREEGVQLWGLNNLANVVTTADMFYITASCLEE